MAETPSSPPTSNGRSNIDSLLLKDAHDYAWKWFEYHARQRLVAFNFLLVLMGALSVGYYQAYDSGAHGYAVTIAIFGAFVALAFYVLEVRNEEFFNVGRDALKSIEKLPEFSSLPEACRLLTHTRKRSRYKAHKFWLRAIEIFLFVIFFMQASYQG